VLAAGAAQGWAHRDVVPVRQAALEALNWTGQWYRRDSRLEVNTLALRMYEVLFPRLHEHMGAGPVECAEVGCAGAPTAPPANRTCPSKEQV
jgi:hypothetical protein